MTKEKLKLVLEALERTGNIKGPAHDREQIAITTIKEVLAQPEQEPVAFINVEQRKLEWAKYMSWATPTVVNLPKIPLYTTPQQRPKVVFPTMLRKMWSGGEVQAWLDENVNKEKNT